MDELLEDYEFENYVESDHKLIEIHLMNRTNQEMTWTDCQEKDRMMIDKW